MNLRVGFIGLGLMGRPMVLRLLRAGYRVTVWNRTPEKSVQIAEEGATIAATPAEAARTSDVIITIVTGPDAVQSVLQGPTGILQGLNAGTTVIDMSTIGLESALTCAEQCHRVDAYFLDAPVTGSVPGAENGSLTIMVGGEKAIFDKYHAMLQVFGQPMYVGQQGMGALIKLTQNLLAAALVESFAEGIRLADAHGLDVDKLSEVLMQTGLKSAFLQLKTEKIVGGDFSPQYTLTNMAKDLQLVVAAGQQGKVALPVAQRLLRVYREGVRAGYGDDDCAILVKSMEGKS